VSVKKAKAKTRAKARAAKKSAAEKISAKKKKGKDIVEIRENISELVKDSAEEIATSVIEVATRTGQLASAKYLFEAVGLYPATEQTVATPVAGSLAHTLLRRMGLPTEPVICDEDETATVVTINAKGANHEAAGLADEDQGNAREGEQEPGVEKVDGEPAE
jgi:hypothetical protein